MRRKLEKGLLVAMLLAVATTGLRAEEEAGADGFPTDGTRTAVKAAAIDPIVLAFMQHSFSDNHEDQPLEEYVRNAKYFSAGDGYVVTGSSASTGKPVELHFDGEGFWFEKVTLVPVDVRQLAKLPGGKAISAVLRKMRVRNPSVFQTKYGYKVVLGKVGRGIWFDSLGRRATEHVVMEGGDHHIDEAKIPAKALKAMQGKIKNLENVVYSQTPAGYLVHGVDGKKEVNLYFDGDGKATKKNARPDSEIEIDEE